MACRKKVIATTVPQILTPKARNFWIWYRELLEKAELVDFSVAAKGHFVLRPALCAVWERIQAVLDNRLQLMDVQNCAFPLSMPSDRSMSDQNNSDHLNISSLRYSIFSSWIQTHRDLPLRLSQWRTLIQDVSHPEAFFRSRELLVQEAHTAHLTELDARTERTQILDLYADLYEGLMAILVVRGHRISVTGNNIPFCMDGAEANEAVMLAYVPELDQYIDAGSCISLGQSVSRKFGITVSDPDITSDDSPESSYVWQNSWYFSNRALGIMLATHGDNEGVVVPPRVAQYQVIIIPHRSPHREPEYQAVLAGISSIQTELSALDVRVKTDLRGAGSAGWKLHEWIIRGAPLCIILGTKELSGQYAAVYRRDVPKQTRRSDIPLNELHSMIPFLLEEIQKNLLQKARTAFGSRQRQVTDWDTFYGYLRDGKEASVCLVPHCLSEECEQQIEDLVPESGKERTIGDRKIRCLCIPLSQPEGSEASLDRCINYRCLLSAQKWAMFGSKFE